MNDPISLAILGTLLTIITGLMAWQAIAIIKAGKNIAVLSKGIEVLEELLAVVSKDLKELARHDSEIAVLKNEVNNIKADVDLLFAKLYEKYNIPRRQ